LHGQYQQDASLQKPADFENFINCVSKNIGGFIDLVCDECTTEQTSRVDWINGLCSILMDKCGCRDMVKTRFQCSQIVANMEELISNCPFGDIEGITLGHGSTVGNSILVLKAQTIDDRLKEILQFIQALPDSDLKLLSLHRYTDGLVRLMVNDRVLNCVDAEHMLCKLYIIYERLKGGSRSTSVSPRLFFEHCHPIQGIAFPRLQSISRDVFGSFRHMVDKGTWELYDGQVDDPNPKGTS
jgi:hypothetical protein